MLSRPTPEMIRALAQLERNGFWDQVLGMVKVELAATYEHMAGAADEAKLRQYQGRAQFIKEFLDLARDAPSKV